MLTNEEWLQMKIIKYSYQGKIRKEKKLTRMKTLCEILIL